MALRIIGKRPPELEHLTEEDIIAALGTPEEQIARLRQFRTDGCIARSPEVRERYKGEYVAVFGGEVIAHAVEFAELLEKLQRFPDASSDAAVHRIDSD